MTIFLLIVLGFNTTVETAENAQTVVRTAKVVHHHLTRPIYHRVLKPIGKTAAEIRSK